MLISEDNTQRGFIIDILTDIFSAKGYQIEFRHFPLARSYLELEKGNVHIIAETLQGVSATSKFIYPKEALFKYKAVFFVATTSNWKYDGETSLDSLANIASIAGYDYSALDQNYEDYLRNNTSRNVTILSGETAIDRIFKMIALGRIDMFCDTQSAGEYIINTYNLTEQVKIVGSLGQPITFKPAFSPRDSRAETLMKIWDEGIVGMQKTDSIEQYLKKYHISY